MSKQLVLFSGGLDSVCTAMVLAAEADEAPDLMYVNCGTPYTTAEQAAVSTIVGMLCHEFPIFEQGVTHYIDMRGVGNTQIEDGTHIPYRNLLLVARAAGYMFYRLAGEEPLEIFLGSVRDDRFTDNCKEAFDAYAATLSRIENRDVAVTSKWFDHAKVEMVTECYKRFGDAFVAIAAQTISCAKGTTCGDCEMCFRKATALMASDIECRKWFTEDPFKTVTAQKMRARVMKQYDSVGRDTVLAMLDAHG